MRSLERRPFRKPPAPCRPRLQSARRHGCKECAEGWQAFQDRRCRADPARAAHALTAFDLDLPTPAGTPAGGMSPLLFSEAASPSPAEQMPCFRCHAVCREDPAAQRARASRLDAGDGYRQGYTSIGLNPLAQTRGPGTCMCWCQTAPACTASTCGRRPCC